ncbi:MAG: hypothetical protein LC800_17695 [Acidobacteria bacterium]|nr:hypothetical protein [Acidobacteriota bacterium]
MVAHATGASHNTSCGNCPDADGYRSCQRDCNDNPNDDGASIHPGQAEICDNNEDDNCDGIIDWADPNCVPPDPTPPPCSFQACDIPGTHWSVSKCCCASNSDGSCGDSPVLIDIAGDGGGTLIAPRRGIKVVKG